jgi:hypothetical protein
MKRLAVVVGGWAFPLHVYEMLAAQKIPEGWLVDFFCVSHRDPEHAEKEKIPELRVLGYTRRELYDRILYHRVAMVHDIERLGFKYTLEPNTIGDWGISNQWLEKNDYRVYDKFLFTHDDNFLLNDRVFVDILPQDDWLILANSTGNTQRRLRRLLRLPKPMSIRGSFEFFTREMMDKLGGSFDMSRVTLTRVGETSSEGDARNLRDWNETVTPLTELLTRENLWPRVKALSPCYRMSIYCLEGERGYIHKTDPVNTAEEELGLDMVEEHYARKK